MSKPYYIDPSAGLGEVATLAAPPFVFRAVTSRVFPLKANMARLSAFCDQYVNMDIPRQIALFRPSLPYVYLMVLNYGSMSHESVEAQNLGWVSQHEVTFTVPLEWWREENGRLVFKEWACVSPFIFVDDQMSLTTGREVYGWPKVACQVDADVPLWISNPQSVEQVFSLSTCVFPKLYAGEHEVPRVLLRIHRAAPPTYSVFPPNPNNPWSPLTSLSDAARAFLSLTGDSIDMLLAPRIRGYHVTRSAGSLQAMFAKAFSNMGRLLPDLLLPSLRGAQPQHPADEKSPRLYIETITVKQFRSVEDPNGACYQALVTSRMGFDRLNHGGLLGDVNLLRGDPSGGFTVRINRYGSQPIIESLGLEVAGEEDDGEGTSVAILKPTLPFWTDVDLHYSKGRVICSRTEEYGHGAVWRDEQPVAQAATPAKAAGDKPKDPRYNAALGAATQPVSGPFTFPDVTLQVYPLLADRTQLDCFVTRYMNAPLHGTGLSFRTCGAYVYMLVNVFDNQLGSMWSSTNNIGWWAEREVTFAVPVKFYRGDELVNLAFLTPFVYANSGRAVITDREVNGRPAMVATIDAPPDAWLAHSGPVAERSMLRLATEMFPALNLGQRGERRTLLEIDARPILPYNADVEWRMVAEQWGVRMVEELKRKTYEAATQREDVENVKALAIELWAHQLPFNWIILKQYRDAGKLDRACYQAVVHTERSITHVHDLREIETGLHVRVHQSALHPIVETLGLVVKSVDSIDGCVVQNLQPWRPFWMRIALEEKLGKVLAWRAVDEDWKPGRDPWFALPASQPVAGTEAHVASHRELHVGSALGRPQALHQDVADEARHWLRKALMHELAWMRVNLRDVPADAQASLRQLLHRTQQHQLDRLLAADSLPAFGDAMPTDALIELTRALVTAGVPVPPLPPLPIVSEDALRSAADFTTALRAIYGEITALPPVRIAAIELTLPPAQRAEFQRLRAAPSVDAYCAATGESASSDRLLMALLQGLGEWAFYPDDLRRLTNEEARNAVHRLDETQLVVESILSDEWGNWGDPRWYRGVAAKPAQCVPVGSVYGTAQALQAQREGFAWQYKLKSFENAWWHVVPPRPQATTDA